MFNLILKCLCGKNLTDVFINHQEQLEQSWKNNVGTLDSESRREGFTYFQTFVDRITEPSTVLFSAIVSVVFFCFVLF